MQQRMWPPDRPPASGPEGLGNGLVPAIDAGLAIADTMHVKIEGDEIGAVRAPAGDAGKISAPVGGPIASGKIEKLFHLRARDERGLRIEIERGTPPARDRCEGRIAQGRTRSFIRERISRHAHFSGRRLRSRWWNQERWGGSERQ